MLNNNLDNAFRKMSSEMKLRLDGYVSDFKNKFKTEDGAYCSVVSYCSALYDCGILRMIERVELSCYYRTLLAEIEIEHNNTKK